MQQHPQMIPMMPTLPPTNITTEQIQKYLDENKKLILAILDNQNLGKLAECAQYQAVLQRNLMYLAAIADSQPQTSAMPSHVGPHPAMQQGGYYMQHPQNVPGITQAPQSGIYAPRMQGQFTSQQQVPLDPHQQQLHAFPHTLPAQMGIKPSSMGYPLDAALGSAMTVQNDGRGRNKADAAAGSDVHGSLTVGFVGSASEGESPFLKGSDDPTK